MQLFRHFVSSSVLLFGSISVMPAARTLGLAEFTFYFLKFFLFLFCVYKCLPVSMLVPSACSICRGQKKDSWDRLEVSMGLLATETRSSAVRG